jgi:predicted nucleic acid-binding protein
MILVLDASIAAKWYLDEVYTELAEKLLEPDLYDLHAPELLLSEVGNILWKRYKSGELSSAESERIASDLLQSTVTYHSLTDLFLPSLIASEGTGHPIYDCFYVTLAHSLGAPFITADRKFFLAMRSTNFKSTMMWIEELG